jgi:hypothetical protein
MIEQLEMYMTWKAFGILAGATILFSTRKALLRVFSALADSATEKLVLAGLRRLAKCTSNKLDDEIITSVEESLKKD